MINGKQRRAHSTMLTNDEGTSMQALRSRRSRPKSSQASDQAASNYGGRSRCHGSSRTTFYARLVSARRRNRSRVGELVRRPSGTIWLQREALARTLQRAVFQNNAAYSRVSFAEIRGAQRCSARLTILFARFRQSEWDRHANLEAPRGILPEYSRYSYVFAICRAIRVPAIAERLRDTGRSWSRLSKFSISDLLRRSDVERMEIFHTPIWIPPRLPEMRQHPTRVRTRVSFKGIRDDELSRERDAEDSRSMEQVPARDVIPHFTGPPFLRSLPTSLSA